MKTPNINNNSKSKIEVYSSKIRNTIINEMLPDYDRCNHTQDICVNLFYQQVYSVTKTKTGYRSNNAFSNDTDEGVTDDHYLAPRLLIRALLENERDILYDEKEFLKIFTLCTQTVKVTKKQNNIVKFKKDNADVIVSELTINKYDKFATWWDSDNNDFDEFPLKNTVPKFFTKFEKSRLKKY